MSFPRYLRGLDPTTGRADLWCIAHAKRTAALR